MYVALLGATHPRRPHWMLLLDKFFRQRARIFDRGLIKVYLTTAANRTWLAFVPFCGRRFRTTRCTAIFSQPRCFPHLYNVPSNVVKITRIVKVHLAIKCSRFVSLSSPSLRYIRNQKAVNTSRPNSVQIYWRHIACMFPLTGTLAVLMTE